MSLISKDLIIKGCADSVRAVLGNSDFIKAGELANTVATLSQGAKLVAEGEVTTSSNATSSARAVKINLECVPDLFLFYRTDPQEDLPAETTGAVCMKCDVIGHLIVFSDSSTTNLNCSFFRYENSPTCSADFTGSTATLKANTSGGALVRVFGSSLYPMRAGTYGYKAYKLWRDETAAAALEDEDTVSEAVTE